MDSDTYMKDRVDHQMAWYSGKSRVNKKYYYSMNSCILVFSALIPFLSSAQYIDIGILGVSFNTSWVVGFLGVCIASLTGISSLMKFQEKWTIYRSTAEALRKEKLLYKTATAPYQGGTAKFNLFVRNVEDILDNETRSWTETMNRNSQEEA